MLDYASIKMLAKTIGRSSLDLIALTQNNDPFYADMKGRRVAAEWFAELWDRHQFQAGIHIRRIHYRLISQDPPVVKPDGRPYRNVRADLDYLNRASRDARFLDLIPLDALKDHRNEHPMIFTPTENNTQPFIWIKNSAPDAVMFVENMPDRPAFMLDELNPRQSHVVEVWIEKSTQNDWLVPLCKRRGVTLVVGEGELSEIRCREAVARSADQDRPVRILYLSDFDPGGRSMPVAVARKMEFYINKFQTKADLTLTPLALSEEQCQDFRLPRTPLKETESRRAKFEDRFGEGATELDALEALHPGEMARLLEDEIDRYLDPTLDERVKDAKWQLEHRLSQIEEEAVAPYQGRLDELEERYDDIIGRLEEWETTAARVWEAIHEKLEANEPNLSEYQPPQPRAPRERDDALFDSKRDYFTQIECYHAWQGRHE